MQTHTEGSNVLRFPAGARHQRDSTRRFCRRRYSSLYLLGARLFNQALSAPIATIMRFVVNIRSHDAGRRFRRSSQTLLRALDDLIVLNTRAYPGNLDVVLQEIEARRRHWQIATIDIQDHGRQGS
jgi:hypothetical protein